MARMGEPLSSSWTNDEGDWQKRNLHPPRWPSLLYLKALQTRRGFLSLVELHLDFVGQRCYSRVRPQQSEAFSVAYELLSNQTTYIVDSEESCDILKTHVGMLLPDFLRHASFKGVEHIHGFPSECWTIGRVPPSTTAASTTAKLARTNGQEKRNQKDATPFATFCHRRDSAGREPVLISIFDGTTYDVLEFTPDVDRQMVDELQVPGHCFSQDNDSRATEKLDSHFSQTSSAHRIREEREISMSERLYSKGGGGFHLLHSSHHSTSSIYDTIADTRVFVSPLSAAVELERRLLLEPALKRKKIRSRVVVG